MPKFASKNIPRHIKQTLLRKVPREVRDYNKNDIASLQYKTLIESFSKEDFVEYENWLHRWGTPGRKRHVMREQMSKKNVPDCIDQLALVRENDLNEHRKILQCLRHRWLNLEEYRKTNVNNNPEKFWQNMAYKLQGTTKVRSHINFSKTWEGTEGRDELIKFLKALFEKQGGKCAITGVPLELQIGTGNPNPNKCSLDRIDSKRGYNHRNVWFVAWWVNAMKSNMGMDLFKERVKLIYNYQTSVDINSK